MGSLLCNVDRCVTYVGLALHPAIRASDLRSEWYEVTSFPIGISPIGRGWSACTVVVQLV